MSDSFRGLSEAQQAERLEVLGRNALEAYDIEVREVTLLSSDWNCVFRVDTEAGPLALRINVPVPGGRAATQEAETSFLDALAEGTTLTVPRPVINRDGASLTIASAPGVPESRECVLFSWVPGDDIAEHASGENWALLGELMATLHTFAESWDAPADLQTLTYDRVFHYEPCTLFDGGALGEHAALLREALERTDGRIAREIQGGLLITHGDLHGWNVKLHEGRAHPIDFEDMQWATPLLDASTSLFYIWGREDYAALFEGFRSGYARSRPWLEREEGEVERLLFSRGFDLLNYVHGQYGAEAKLFGRLLDKSVALARIALG